MTCFEILIKDIPARTKYLILRRTIRGRLYLSAEKTTLALHIKKWKRGRETQEF